MTNLVLSACLLLFLALLATGCIESNESGKYFEIVLQDPYCNGSACFDELLFLEDGLVLKKQQIQGNDYTVSFCQTTPSEFNSLLSEIAKGLKASRFEECNSCAKYHLFYNDGKESKYSSVKAESAAFEKQVFAKAQKLCAMPSNAELFHVISGKGNSFKDYHVFSNGIVVFEKFGMKDGELLESKVSMLKAGEFEELKKQIPAKSFETETLDNCPANGFFYGFVEAKLSDNYDYAFTCGDSTPKGIAFQNLAGRFS
ncbi:MAG: hypothetical protein Q7R70_01320 [Candidatus Diapherotrites archaeon]|nr:hypothetical protein [Candidatus Diapherotrites archaeon]